MNSERDQLQALISEIDGVLRKMSSRMAWWMSGDTRQILERVRNFLVSLEQKNQVLPPSSPGSSASRSAIVSGDDHLPLATTGQNQATAAWQALVGEMNTLRTQVMQPMVADLAALREQKDSLLKEIQELELRRQHDYSLAQQQANQQKVISEFLHILMGRLQENLTQSVTQFLSHIESQVLVYGSSDRPGRGAIAGDTGSSIGDRLLDPQERLEHLRMLQAQSDQLLISLDNNLRVIFEAVQRNVRAYQESLLQELEKMHRLSHRNEAIFSQLVYQLAQELGQESSTYLPSSLKLTEENRAVKSPENQGTTNTPASLLSPGKPEIFETLISTLPTSDQPEKSDLSGASPNQDRDMNRDMNRDTNPDLVQPSERPSSEPAEFVRSLENLGELISELDLTDFPNAVVANKDLSELPSELPSELLDLDSYLALPEENLLATEEPVTENLPPELPVDTGILQQLSEDLLNLQILEEAENQLDADLGPAEEISPISDNWGWGEAIAEESTRESTGDRIASSPELDAPTAAAQPAAPAKITRPEVALPPQAAPQVAQQVTEPVTEPVIEEEDLFADFMVEDPSPRPVATPTTAASVMTDPVADPFGKQMTEPETEPKTEPEDIFADFIVEDPAPNFGPVTTPAASPAKPATYQADRADEPAEEPEDIFADFMVEDSTPVATPAIASAPEAPQVKEPMADRTEEQADEREDIFADFIAAKPTSLAKNKTQPMKTPNVKPTKTSATISRKAIETVQNVFIPLVSLPESAIDDLSLDEIFAELVAASPPPPKLADSEDWVEIEDLNPSPSAIAPAQPEPADEINSSVDDFFARLDLTTETAQTETLNDSENQDLSDIDRWISEPNSELNLASEDS